MAETDPSNSFRTYPSGSRLRANIIKVMSGDAPPAEASIEFYVRLMKVRVLTTAIYSVLPAAIGV